MRFLLLLVVLALLGAGAWSVLHRDKRSAPAAVTRPAGARASAPGVAGPGETAPVKPLPKEAATAAAPKAVPEVAIQDGKTIDFSSGKPVVKDDPKERAAIEQSVSAMDAAAADVTFAPRKPASAPAK